jgi:hypothetical protein
MLPVTGLMPVKNGWLCHSRSDLLTVGIRYTLVYLANSSFYVISYKIPSYTIKCIRFRITPAMFSG